METKHIDILDTFDINSLPDLDIAVLGALELLANQDLPKMNFNAYQHPLVVGSGNAEATGRIIFQDHDAIFASESNFENKLKNIPGIDGVILISSSGEKHAPIIARKAREYGKHVSLITNSKNSSASQELDHKHDYDEYIFPKNREPYTYNTSTYMGMIIGQTKEEPAEIYDFITKTIAIIDMQYIGSFNKYYLIVPPEFSNIIRMLNVKFIELFGRNIARDIETSEYVRHATTVVPADEIFISFGEINNKWGKLENRLTIPLPANASYAAMMAIGYYIIGQIQKKHSAYFKNNIQAYTQELTKMFSQEVSPIVER